MLFALSNVTSLLKDRVDTHDLFSLEVTLLLVYVLFWPDGQSVHLF